MYSNDKIIQNLKQSLFQDTEEAFNEFFGPFIVENDSFNPDSVSIKKDIKIKNEPKINFFVKKESDDEQSDNSDSDSEKDDDIPNFDYELLTQSETFYKKNSKASNLSTSMRMKPKPKQKSKAKLKKKIVMV